MVPGWRVGSRWLRRASYKLLLWQARQRGYAATAAAADPVSRSSHGLEFVRNIGIIAHIDAGKTTTTERMLYYGGFTRRIGDVDEGSTVTDFLPAERARGITIQSAAISFYWPPKKNEGSNQYTINLIDTPGHADFTFEVIRSLRILDGAVCILDGVAGVEAQTEKVWHQASGYSIPRLIYVNKLDRNGAAFYRTVKEIASRLNTFPALCQIPWWRNGKFIGVGDVVNLCGLQWNQDSDGSNFTTYDWTSLQNEDAKLAKEIHRARIALIELLTEHDDTMVETFLEEAEDYLAIKPASILSSLRNNLLSRKQTVTPLFLGASFRNIGVQPLLDAVTSLLPSPYDAGNTSVKVGGYNTTLKMVIKQNDIDMASKRPSATVKAIQSSLLACALAFKVVNDARRGVLVYVRVYSGSITRNALLYNTSLSLSERVPRLLRMYASDAVEIQSIDEGQIGVLAGLKHARTGDTLIVTLGSTNKSGPPSPLRDLQLRPIAVPPPVFFTSVEPNSLSEEKTLSDALTLLLREDPSLHVSIDPESGQTHLAGMGELHLDIARDRLLNDYKVKASTGPIEISYRESVREASAQCTETLDHDAAAPASCQASVSALSRDFIRESHDRSQVFRLSEENVLVVDHPTLLSTGKPAPDAGVDVTNLPPSLPMATILDSFRAGVSVALARGPKHAFPMYSTVVCINFEPQLHITPTTTPAALTAAARAAVRAALQDAALKSEPAVMEPVMDVSIVVPEDAMGAVVHDLSASRGGHILSLDEDGAAAGGQGEELLWTAGEKRSTLLHKLSLDQLKRVYAPPDPFGGGVDEGIELQTTSSAQRRLIRARVPLKEMVGYLKHLRSLTGGRGTFVMSVDRFEEMNAQRLRLAFGRQF